MASRASAAASAKAAKEVYRGYMPIDLPQHRPKNRIRPWFKVVGKPMVTLYPKKQIEGYSEEPEYPPLFDGSRSGVKTQVRLDWYESLKSIPTAEQKLHEIVRHATHYIAHLKNWPSRYNSLPMLQYLTQTNVVDSLPANYTQPLGDNPNEQQLHDHVKQIILDQIALAKHHTIKGQPGFVSKIVRDGSREAHVSNTFIQNLMSNIKKVIALESNPQLLDYHYDLSPAIRSWWYHSGLGPPNNKIFYKSRKDADGHINQMIQMDGSAAMTIRADSMMEPIVPMTDSIVTDTSLVNKDNYALKHYGALYKYKWPVALAGFWFEEKPTFDFPHTCVLSTDCLDLRNSLKPHKIVKPMDDEEDCLNGQAISTAFSWLNSLSMYHGYTPFQELDYPFTCQVVTTDGKNWVFNVYQLNCHSFHRDLGGPSRNNICWTSGKMQLYQEYIDGEFKGVNDDVVKLIIRFLSQKTSPAYMSELELRRYLSEDNRTDEEKDTIRKELRKCYEGRTNKWLSHDWRVPLWEHVFFRSKVNRHRITHMKPRWHIPKPKYPKIFE